MTSLPILLRSLAVSGLLTVALPPLDAQTPGTHPYAGWPKTWVEAYHRFERYNAERLKYFPAANLEISPDGRIFHTVRLVPGTTEHLGIDFYGDGAQILGMAMNEQFFDQGRSRLFPPRKYTAGLRSSGLTGYQYLYPLLWFETYRPETEPRESNPNPDSLRIRAIPAPQPEENFWPNERLLKFLDFHVFPNRNPREVYQKNSKVNPCVTLRLTNFGVIVRDKLDPALEKLLHWRIYFNGELIEKGPAGEMADFNADRGSGSYQVFVGVEGPGGFMPVSNYLQFPLFPEKSGKQAVFPSVTNPEKLPDFFLDMFDHHQLDEILSRPHKGPDNAYYNKRSISLYPAPGSFRDQKSEELYTLWRNWSWHLNSAIEKSGDNLTGLAGVLDKPGVQ